MTDDIWGVAQNRLKTQVGQNNYVTWIEPLRFRDLQDGILTFDVQSQFMGNWVERYFGDAILREVAAMGEAVDRLSFVVNRSPRPPKSAPATAQEPVPARPAARSRMGQENGLPLEPLYTFDTFVVGKSNELAHAAARRVADSDEVSFNPLFLYGGVGLGKTHLMHAIGWELRNRRPDAKIVYVSAEDFMYRFVRALREKDMMGFKEMFRSIDVLMVDDVKFIAGKDATQEEFFHTFNSLVEQKKQIILSSDAAPGEIDGLEKRIVSRLNSGLVIDIHPTSYELRLGILQRKVEVFGDRWPGARIGDGVLEFLAHKISSNVRELEGALTKLFAHSSFLDREVDLELAQECLRDMLKTVDRRTTIDEIQRKTADHYGIKLADLIGPRRNRVYARPRQVAMYLAKEMTDRSLPEIARKFGGRDHTTIMYGIRQIEKLSATDSALSEDLDLLRKALRWS
ncbi:chromosomal replication initiator protein DnaA [Palleronia caenipelagi]|uniref:Chromosomal replication initiator protein DnaA n=1 Tax=Palleronia caenipelagi TaxID=2489174 RepID=A0A547Q7K7_9RHOB|nr:chromosomal replication initiator protein DnaA [Palleronia caenipelagi]TRD22377.1 chromosomal replication initiator protein DnaA [Palleronia caenipelagi]